MKVDIANQQNHMCLNRHSWARRARQVLQAERAEGDLSVAFVDDAQIRELNRRFLRRDRPTDVLAFPSDDDDPLLGEVVISAERAKSAANERGIDPDHELALYLVHGVLHLVGYNDHTPSAAAKMHAREDELLVQMGFGPIWTEERMPDGRHARRN